MKMVAVRISMHLPAIITKKGKWFVANCPILDVYSQGETEQKAKENLKEALSLFFISCYERGTLDSVLKSCGFKAEHSLPAPTTESDYIDVPIPFIVDWDKQRRCHA